MLLSHTSLTTFVIIIAMGTSASAVSNIRNTKHNLSLAYQISKDSSEQSDDELCIYCHTPNTSKTAFINTQLWNKSLTGETFIMYGSSADKADIDKEMISSNSSMACLSCHDGINAINVMVNTAATNHSYPSSIPPIASNPDSGSISGSSGKNHPISVTYNEGKAGLKSASSSLMGWAGASTINSVLRNNKIECGSCHDPHEATNGTFLRVVNSGSELCTGCHAK